MCTLYQQLSSSKKLSRNQEMPRKAAKTLKAFRGGAPPIIQVMGGPAGGFVPPLPALPLPTMDPLSSMLLSMSGNPYTIGIFYIILNLGGRFLTLELTKRQEWFLAQPFMRPFILFAVMFIATRNLAVAFYTTLGVLAVLWLFANENSVFCMIPGWRDENSKKEKEAQDKSYEDTMKAIKKHHEAEIPDVEHHDEQQLQAQPTANEQQVQAQPTANEPVPALAVPTPAVQADTSQHNDNGPDASHLKNILERPEITNDSHKPEHLEDLYR